MCGGSASTRSGRTSPSVNEIRLGSWSEVEQDCVHAVVCGNGYELATDREDRVAGPGGSRRSAHVADVLGSRCDQRDVTRVLEVHGQGRPSTEMCDEARQTLHVKHPSAARTRQKADPDL